MYIWRNSMSWLGYFPIGMLSFWASSRLLFGWFPIGIGIDGLEAIVAILVLLIIGFNLLAD